MQILKIGRDNLEKNFHHLSIFPRAKVFEWTNEFTSLTEKIYFAVGSCPKTLTTLTMHKHQSVSRLLWMLKFSKKRLPHKVKTLLKKLSPISRMIHRQCAFHGCSNTISGQWVVEMSDIETPKCFCISDLINQSYKVKTPNLTAASSIIDCNVQKPLGNITTEYFFVSFWAGWQSDEWYEFCFKLSRWYCKSGRDWRWIRMRLWDLHQNNWKIYYLDYLGRLENNGGLVNAYCVRKIKLMWEKPEVCQSLAETLSGTNANTIKVHPLSVSIKWTRTTPQL